MREFDVVVIGAGPAGEVAAGRLASGGLEVAIVEDRLVGGECSFWACMPSKALLRPGQALAEARRVPGAAEAATGTLDVAAALARRDEVIHDLDDASQLPWLEDRGIVLLRGQARVTGERRVTVGEEELAARGAVVVATGSAPAMPPVDGLAAARPWTNREVTTASRVPEHLAILGGGVVGVEMAQAWTSLGSRVTLIEPSERVLSREEPFAAEEVAAALAEAGVDLRCGTAAAAVRREDGVVTVELDDGGRVEATELLVATGRRQNTTAVEPLGYEAGRPVEVDDQLRSLRHDWLFAIGDVNGRQLLTHMGKHQARVAADVLLGKDARLRPSADPPPRVVFTEPAVAAVGHTLASAQEAGIDARAVDVPTSATAGASFRGRDTPGTCRIVVDERRRVLVGATFTGVGADEFLHAATIAVVGEVPLDDLFHAVPAFPARSEVWLRLLESYGL